MRRLRPILLLALIFGSVSILVLSQDRAVCTAVMEEAISIVDEQCSGLGRNKTCYGNNQIFVETQTDDTMIVFDNPGDQTLITDLASMQLSPLDTDSGVWGVALFRLQAINIENSVPGQQVTVLAFGGTRIESRALSSDSQATLDPESDDEILETLQAFSIQTGIGTSQCLDIPSDGLLIQSARGANKVKFEMNGIDVQLGSTIFVQSLPNDALYLYVLDGQVVIQVLGETITIPKGTFVSVPMTFNSFPDGNPSVIQPYDSTLFETLPVALLPEDFEWIGLDVVHDQLLISQGYTVLPNVDVADNAIALKVTATQPWVRTPIQLSAGQTVTITASGTATSCNHDDCDEFYQQYVDADGLDNTCPQCIMIDVPEMALVGRIGDGEPFLVGTNLTFTVESDGQLFLAANDEDIAYNDNEGMYDIIVSIE